MKNLFGYPGNKKNIIPKIEWKNSHTYIDYFVGAGSFLLYQFQKNPNSAFIIADKDPAILAVYKACQNAETRNKVIDSTIALRDEFLKNPDSVWNQMKSELRSSTDLCRLASLKLFYQRLSHGCIARTRSDGKKLNVIWSIDKTLTIKNWQPMLPDLTNCNLSIYDDWQKIPSVSGSVAFLDPPYYAPGKTPSYPEHKPGSMVTLLAVINSTQKAITDESRQIVLTHYYIPAIENCLLSFPDVTVDIQIGNELKSLSRGIGNFRHGLRTNKLTKYQDAIWYIKHEKR